jgi:hypothetical protein
MYKRNYKNLLHVKTICIWKQRKKVKKNSDSAINEDVVKYAAAQCIDKVTMEKIKAFFSGGNSE